MVWCQRVDDRDSRYSVVVEDDGRVAFAYLLDSGRIVADVWLYNCVTPSKDPEWKTGAVEAPFQNPPEFAPVDCRPSLEDASKISAKWKWNSDGTLIWVDVLHDGIVFGRIGPDTKPGWAKLAIKDGPLAKVLVE